MIETRVEIEKVLEKYIPFSVCCPYCERVFDLTEIDWSELTEKLVISLASFELLDKITELREKQPRIKGAERLIDDLVHDGIEMGADAILENPKTPINDNSRTTLQNTNEGR